MWLEYSILPFEPQKMKMGIQEAIPRKHTSPDSAVHRRPRTWASGNAHFTCAMKMEWNHSEDSACRDLPLQAPKDSLLAGRENNLLFLNPLDTSLSKSLVLWNKGSDLVKNNFLKNWVPNNEKHYHLSNVVSRHSHPSLLSKAVVWKSSDIQVVALFSNVCHAVWLLSMAASSLHPPSFYLHLHLGRLWELVHFGCLFARTFCVRSAPEWKTCEGSFKPTIFSEAGQTVHPIGT